MSRRQAVISLAAGLVLLVAAPLVWWSTRPEPAGQTVANLNAAAAGALAGSTATSQSGAPLSTIGTVSAVAPGSSDSARSTASGPPAEPATTRPEQPTPPPEPAALEPNSPAPEPVAPEPEPTSDAPSPAVEAAAAPTADAGVPVTIDVPALGVDSTVVPVGVTADGNLEVPSDVNDIGWYRYGPVPGAAAGSAVLTGHVDSSNQGRGAFAALGDLQPGDRLTLVDDAGTTRTFEVLSREEWSKSEVPLDRIFDRGGSPRLVLITCGGAFDQESRHYEDNIAVTAVPVI